MAGPPRRPRRSATHARRGAASAQAGRNARGRRRSRRRAARRRPRVGQRYAASARVAVAGAASTKSRQPRGLGAQAPRSRHGPAHGVTARTPGSAGRGGRSAARLLDDHVRVGAADPERRDAGPPRASARGHGGLGEQLDLAPATSRCAGGSSTCSVAGSCPCRMRQHHLDHAGDAGGGLGVADVRLDRPSQSGRRRRAPARRSRAAPAPRSDRRASCRCRGPRPRRRRRARARRWPSACRMTRCWDGPFGAVSPLAPRPG